MYIAYSPYQDILSDNPTWTFFAYLDIVYLTKIELNQFRTIFQSESSEMEFGLKQGIVLIFGLVIALPRVSKLLFGTQGSLTTHLTKEITDIVLTTLLLYKAKASIRPARPRLDRRARIQFWGVLNISLCAHGAQLS